MTPQKFRGSLADKEHVIQRATEATVQQNGNFTSYMEISLNLKGLKNHINAQLKCSATVARYS